MTTPEHDRPASGIENNRWQLWGPYLAERTWGTVREDYSADGDPWGAFPHDIAPAQDPAWSDLVLFHEYFNADTGEGLGASHQTGWTGLVADLIDEKSG